MTTKLVTITDFEDGEPIDKQIEVLALEEVLCACNKVLLYVDNMHQIHYRLVDNIRHDFEHCKSIDKK